RSELPFGPGDPMYLALLRSGREAIETKYRQEGFAKATVELDQTAALLQKQAIYRITEGPRIRIRKISFEGNEFFSTIRLRFHVRTNARFWPFIPGYLNIEKVEQDVASLRKLYIDEGFLEAQVDYLLKSTPDQEDQHLTFVINEGPRFLVNQIRFEGNTLFSDKELAGRMKLARGEYVVAEDLQRDIRVLGETYGELGYIQSDVNHRFEYLPPNTELPDWAAKQADDDLEIALVNLVFDVRESDRYDVGQVVIRGNDLTQDRVIRRHVTMYPGQRFNTSAMQESQRRLRETTLFETVEIKPIGQDESVRDVLVEITEGRTANFIIGIAADSSNGIFGDISFTQRNFDLLGWPGPGREFWKGRAFKGAGQRLRLSAQPGTTLSRFYIDWFEPALFDQPYALSVNGYYYTREQESYDITRLGIVTSLGHRFKNRWYGEVAAKVEWAEMDDLDSDAPIEVVDDQGDHFMPSVKGTLVRDRTDSRWLPSMGDRFEFSYEQFVGDYAFGRFDASYRIFRTLYVNAAEEKHILAGKIGVGQVVGDAPVFESYYAGGLGSLRGFQYRGVSPRGTNSDDPIGGDSLFLLGAEYSYPIVGDTLRGVLFIDSGTVEDSLSLSDYRVSAGFGFRWTVPLFGPVPISLDFGFPISKEDEDDTQVFSFSLGWRF
ncbi:MAG: outer membrane protein assembly factor BamA, partial [Planctomycetota bacterium]